MKILSQQMIKKNNLKKVFASILRHMPISRVELSKMTQLSKTTISSLVDELIVEGFVVDDGEVDTGRQGRRPNALRANHENNVVAVINWHNEEMEAALVDLCGKIVFQTSVCVEGGSDFPALIRETYETKLLREAGRRRVLAFCLIVPSMLDSQSKKMISTTLPVPLESDVLERMCDLFREIPVAVFNDTACYAYAECTLAHLPFNTFTYINISKGVGAVIVLDGVMLRGEGGMRSQLGHYSLYRDGEPCICGNRGCLENEIGETALEHRAQRLGVYKALLAELAAVDAGHAGRGCITFRGIGALADTGSAVAREFVGGLADDLAYTLGNVATIYNTSHIIVGGRGQGLGRYYMERLSRQVRAVGFKTFVERLRPQYSTLGSDAILRGAARYFIDKYYDFPQPAETLVVLE